MEQALISSDSSRSGIFPCFQQPHSHGGHVHQGDVFLGKPVAVDLPPGVVIGLEGVLNHAGEGALLHGDIRQTGEEGGVAAVVGPIGVDDPQLGDGGIPLLLIPEIVPAESQIFRGHGEAHFLPVGADVPLIHADEALDPGHVVRPVSRHVQGVGLVQRGHAGFHRVDQILLHPAEIGVGQPAAQANHPGGSHPGPLPLGQKLHALGR